jgi:hypothetical protein
LKFERRKHLVDHSKEEHNIIMTEAIKCPTCTEQFDSKDDVLAHRMSAHDFLKCRVCKRQLRSSGL